MECESGLICCLAVASPCSVNENCQALQVGMVAQACTPRLGRLRQENCHEFEASLGYPVSFWLAWRYSMRPLLK